MIWIATSLVPILSFARCIVALVCTFATSRKPWPAPFARRWNNRRNLRRLAAPTPKCGWALCLRASRNQRPSKRWSTTGCLDQPRCCCGGVAMKMANMQFATFVTCKRAAMLFKTLWCGTMARPRRSNHEPHLFYLMFTHNFESTTPVSCENDRKHVSGMCVCVEFALLLTTSNVCLCLDVCVWFKDCPPTCQNDVHINNRPCAVWHQLAKSVCSSTTTRVCLLSYLMQSFGCWW